MSLFIFMSVLGLTIVFRVELISLLKRAEDYLFLTESQTKFVNGEAFSVLIRKFESGYIPKIKD